MTEPEETQPEALSQTRARFTLEGLQIPEDASKIEWYHIHKNALLCHKASSKWLKQSREFGTRAFGEAFAAGTEAQLTLDLGLPTPEDKPLVNPDDKSTALVTIEGISQSFSMWQRKMEGSIPDWDRDQAKKALDLLEPIARQYEEIKRMIE
jgi:hypothetical protein